MDEFFIKVVLQAQTEAPDMLILDVDATDDQLHGRQEGRFFHGYYRGYCYLPLYIFCGDFLLSARLRTADKQPAGGALLEIGRIVKRLREHWPKVRILVRGDSGFSREEILKWCESNDVDYLFGQARNKRLEKMLAEEMACAKQQFDATGKAARVFSELRYQSQESWSRDR